MKEEASLTKINYKLPKNQNETVISSNSIASNYAATNNQTALKLSMKKMTRIVAIVKIELINYEYLQVCNLKKILKIPTPPEKTSLNRY